MTYRCRCMLVKTDWRSGGKGVGCCFTSDLVVIILVMVKPTHGDSISVRGEENKKVG